MSETATKPKLVFFQYKYDTELPEFLLIHKRDHVKCLSQFFDVTVIDRDCDYQEVCDRHEPDIALFERGIDNFTCDKVKIRNPRACPNVPKIGWHNADAFSGSRAGFLSDMDHLGIETFFAISTTAAEHTPEIAKNLFVWPNFVDPEIYRDYGEWKSIPVLLTGNKTGSFYPWRQKIFRLMAERFPVLSSPHPGYNSGSSPVVFVTGEKYARTINASAIVPTCGTVAMDIVRKHFEIPACRACLVAERSPAVEAAGFRDMENCVFADEHDVLDKVAHLFRNPDELQRITQAGFELVQSRHTFGNRDQIRQWLDLHRSLKPGQRIIQTGPFEPLVVVSVSEGHKHSHLPCDGPHLVLLRQANKWLAEGRYDDAEEAYMKCLNYLRWLPEAKVGLALCNLYKGDASAALSWLEQPLFVTLGQYKAVDPDPVEWAYFIVATLCLGRVTDASRHAGEFPWLHHPELDRARWAAAVLSSPDETGLRLAETKKRRMTLHSVGEVDLNKWIERICVMLRTCGRGAMADTLVRFGAPIARAATEDGDLDRARVAGTEAGAAGTGPVRRTSGRSTHFLKRQLFYRNARTRVGKRVGRLLHQLEKRFGYFLPYHVSALRGDEFYEAIRTIARENDVKNVLLIGPAIGDPSTQAIVAGLHDSANDSARFCVISLRKGRFDFARRPRRYPALKAYDLSTVTPELMPTELKKTVETIKREHEIGTFEVVLIDSSPLGRRRPAQDDVTNYLDGARFIFLADVNGHYNFENHQRLLDSPDYVLFAANPALRNGYALYRLALSQQP